MNLNTQKLQLFLYNHLIKRAAPKTEYCSQSLLCSLTKSAVWHDKTVSLTMAGGERVKFLSALTDTSDIGSGMTTVVKRRLVMDADGCRDTSSANNSGIRRRPLTLALATAADTRVNNCSGPDSRLNSARMVSATPAVNGCELSKGCSTNVWQTEKTWVTCWWLERDLVQGRHIENWEWP